MKLPLCALVCSLCFLQCQAYVSVDDCTEEGAHRYHAHSAQSASYSSGYTQDHPTPSGHAASSSQYMRTGGVSSRLPVSSYSGQSAALTSGYRAGVIADNEDDMQVATSYYSPVVAKGSYQPSGGRGGYGLYQPTSSSYNSNVESQSRNSIRESSYGSSYGAGGTSGSSYGAGSGSTAGYGTSHENRGAVLTADQHSSDSHVRQKFEDLKHKADAFVHSGAPPPVGVSPVVPLGRVEAHGSGYQSSQRYGSTSGAGNVLGISYGSTGSEEAQRLIPVPATLPASESALAAGHRQSHESSVSYSSSGTGTHSDGVDFSISQSAPSLAATQSSYTSSQRQHVESQDFNELKQKADAFVHGGAPPPTSQLSSDSLQQSSTRVETLPAKATNRGTIIVPVRVTVTREQTVLPGSTGQYYAGNELQGSGTVVSGKKESYSSHSSSSSSVSQPQTVSYQTGSIDTIGNTGGVYSSQGVGVPTGSTSYSYKANSQISGSKGTPQVYTVGPQGSVFFPAENVAAEKSTGYGATNAYTQQSSVHRENVIVPGAVAISNGEDYEKKSNKLFDLVSGYGTFLPAKEEEVPLASSDSQSVKTASSSSSTSGGSSGGYSTNYQSGYQGVAVPAGSLKKTTTVYSSYNSNNVAPTHISPGVPVGDPISPPEVSGSYFSNGKRYSSSSSYGATRNENLAGVGGYGVGRDQSVGYTGGYGVRDQNLATSSGYGVSRDQSLAASSGYNSGYRNQHVARDQALAIGALNTNCGTLICDDVNLIGGSAGGLGATGGVKKYGISSSWSSKSQTVNGKTVESKEAQVTVNDNGKVDTYATHNRK